VSRVLFDPRLGRCPWDPTDGLERARRRLAILIPANVLLAVWYFLWLCQPNRVGNPVLFGLLLICEFFNLSQALGFWWTAFHARRGRGRATPAEPQPETTRMAVDVLIPVFNEPLDIVEPTVRAAGHLLGAVTHVYLLDDKGRDDLEEMAGRHGACYIRRPVNRGAKAGNLNNALALTSSPYVAVFDCDHVPDAAFLAETMPLLADPDVAFVQTPQYYANRVGRPMTAAAWSQQALFFGVIAQGKANLGSMFCCGTNVLFRREALEDVGGFPEESLTEDFLLSVKLQERGWQTRYLPRVLAQGLGPEDPASYVSQQRRWATGCIGALPSIVRSRLRWRQRLQYLLSATFFLTGWTILIYMSLPVIRILTGAQPLARATAGQFLSHFIPYYTLSVMIVAVAGAGNYTFNAFCVFVSNYWVQIDATVAALRRRAGGFVVTPKRGSGERQLGAVTPALNTAGILALVAVNGLLISPTPGTLNNVAFAGFHVCLLVCGVWPALMPARSAGSAAGRAPMLLLPALPADVGDNGSKAALRRPSGPSRVVGGMRRAAVPDETGS
jgi:cellulose synthase (UDP-forming)